MTKSVQYIPDWADICTFWGVRGVYINELCGILEKDNRQTKYLNDLTV